MKKFYLSWVLGIVLMFAGCAIMDSIFIPEQGEIKSDTVKVVDGVTTGLVATGNPIAVPTLAISGVLSVIAGVYTNMRKKQKLVAADDKYEQTRIVTESIVKAIELASEIKIAGGGETLGDVIKGNVEALLKDKDAYVIGKTIITALKERE